MRVTYISATRILSDRNYGNYQATAHAELEPGDDPAVEFAKLRQLADDAANGKLAAAKAAAPARGKNGERELVRYPIR
jgi:hypothetical protein